MTGNIQRPRIINNLEVLACKYQKTGLFKNDLIIYSIQGTQGSYTSIDHKKGIEAKKNLGLLDRLSNILCKILKKNPTWIQLPAFTQEGKEWIWINQKSLKAHLKHGEHQLADILPTDPHTVTSRKINTFINTHFNQNPPS